MLKVKFRNIKTIPTNLITYQKKAEEDFWNIKILSIQTGNIHKYFASNKRKNYKHTKKKEIMVHKKKYK